MVHSSLQVSLMPNISVADRRRTFVKPPKPEKKKKVEVVIEEPSETESEDSPDEDNSDPDWRKTPLFRKIRRITRGNRLDDRSDDSDEENRKKLLPKGTKRDSSGEIKCGCKGDCLYKLCKCRKNSNSCGLKCKCNVLKCKNRETPDNSLSDSSKQDTFLNSTFDVGNFDVLQENGVNKKARLNDTVTVHKDNDMGSLKTTLNFENSPSLF